ncbi:MAG: SDR family oxidoreductase, partial [Bacteroidales bacterium]|nr:SDR family oxidoreductase [Bacteroidales bacterium]
MNILVNGGSHGIGREVVTYYAKSKDNQIVATGRDEAALKELVSGSKHGNVTYIVMDLARTDEQESQIKEQLYRRFSSLDIVINNAGILITGDFMKLTSDDARHLMEVNFIGPAALIRM